MDSWKYDKQERKQLILQNNPSHHNRDDCDMIASRGVSGKGKVNRRNMSFADA